MPQTIYFFASTSYADNKEILWNTFLKESNMKFSSSSYTSLASLTEIIYFKLVGQITFEFVVLTTSYFSSCYILMLLLPWLPFLRNDGAKLTGFVAAGKRRAEVASSQRLTTETHAHNSSSTTDNNLVFRAKGKLVSLINLLCQLFFWNKQQRQSSSFFTTMIHKHVATAIAIATHSQISLRKNNEVNSFCLWDNTVSQSIRCEFEIRFQSESNDSKKFYPPISSLLHTQ